MFGAKFKDMEKYTQFLRYRLELAEETLSTVMNDKQFSRSAVEMQSDIVRQIKSELKTADLELIGSGVGISKQYEV